MYTKRIGLLSRRLVRLMTSSAAPLAAVDLVGHAGAPRLEESLKRVLHLSCGDRYTINAATKQYALRACRGSP